VANLTEIEFSVDKKKQRQDKRISAFNKFLISGKSLFPYIQNSITSAVFKHHRNLILEATNPRQPLTYYKYFPYLKHPLTLNNYPRLNNFK
jgi:hypothetical protein